jgi:hypothetical protein
VYNAIVRTRAIARPGEVTGAAAHLVRHAEPGQVLGVVVVTHTVLPITHPPGEVLGVKVKTRTGSHAGEVLGCTANLEAVVGIAVQMLDRQTAKKNLFNLSSTVETALYTLPIPAGTMGPSSVIKCWVHGELSNNIANAVFTFSVSLGSTLLWSDSIQALPALGFFLPWQFELLLANLGAQNSQFLAGKLFLGKNLAANSGVGDLSAIGLLANPFDNFAIENTLNATTLTITVRCSANSSSAGLTRYNAYAEITP